MEIISFFSIFCVLTNTEVVYIVRSINADMLIMVNQIFLVEKEIRTNNFANCFDKIYIYLEISKKLLTNQT